MFFRIQGKGHTLEEMQAHRSANGADEDIEFEDGLCACDSVSALRSYIKGAFLFGQDPATLDPDFEVVVFRGRRVGEVYDGVLTYPEEIIERVSVSEFFADDRFCDYEE